MGPSKILHGLTLEEGISLNSSIGGGKGGRKSYNKRPLTPTEAARLVAKIYEADDGNFDNFVKANRKKISKDTLDMFYKFNFLPEEVKILIRFKDPDDPIPSLIPIFEATRLLPRLKEPSHQIIVAKAWAGKDLLREQVRSIVVRVNRGVPLEEAMRIVEEMMEPVPVQRIIHIGLLEKEIHIKKKPKDLTNSVSDFLFSKNYIKRKEDLVGCRVDKKTYLLILQTKDSKKPKFPANLSSIFAKFLNELNEYK